MSIAPAVSARVLIGAMFASGLLALHGCGDQSSERRGGAGMPNLTAGAGGMLSEAGASGGGGAAADGLVPWCAAYKVINRVCQQCHQNPPVNGAPIPLMTYADTQAHLPASSANAVWMTALGYVSSGFMPFTGDPSVVPPVKPLTAEQKDTLLTWLNQGALDVGGTDCPMGWDWSKGPPSDSP